MIQDGWVNSLIGLGNSLTDRALSTTYSAATRLDEATISALYTHDWLARRIVQLLPEQALRKGVVSDVWDRFTELNRHELYPHGVLQQALFQGRAFGGSVLIGGFRYGEPFEPLSNTELLWLDACPWHWLSVLEREQDANQARFGLPTVLLVGGQHPRRGLKVHVSRCIVCTGLPPAEADPQARIPWLSVLEPVYQVLQSYGLSWAGVGQLVNELSIKVLKLKGLTAMISQTGQTALEARQRALSLGMTSTRTLFLDADADESLTRVDVSLTALPQLMQQICLQMSGAADMPATVLFGREPAGLSSTGESDTRQWYDRVSAYQIQDLEPKLRVLLGWIAGRAVDLQWPSLWEPTALEAAQLRKTHAEADSTWVMMGAASALDVASSRAEDGSMGLTVDLGALVQPEPEPEPEPVPEA